MKFVILNEEEFKNGEDEFSNSTYLQTSAWAKLKICNGWKPYFVGVKKDNEIIASSLLLAKKVFFNKAIFYAPRGPLLDYDNMELLKFFMDNIYEFVKRNNGFLFKIDPLVEYIHHDSDGNRVDDGFSNELVHEELLKIGFKHKGFRVGYVDDLQYRWSYTLDIDKSFDEIIKNMNQRGKRSVKKSEKYPLILKEMNNDNIDDFKGIMEHTAKRQNHYDRSKEYYLSMKKSLDDKISMPIIYLDKNEFLKNFSEDKLFDEISREEKDLIPISAGVFIFDKNRANYVYGGTYQKYMPLMAQYKMQMEMIKLAQKRNIKIYDFGGISGDFNPDSPEYGVYAFKKNFNGKVIEFIGEYDLAVNKLFYYMYVWGYKTYRNMKKVLAKIKNCK